MMNAFPLDGFLNIVQNLPSQIIHRLNEDLQSDTASVTPCIVTLVVLVTVVEATVLILCKMSKWFPEAFDGQRHFWWEEDTEENEEQRCQRIQESLTEQTWNDPREPCCSVCLSDYQVNDVVVGSPKCCHHVFHKECLHQWLMIASACPCCRQEMLKDAPPRTTKDAHERLAAHASVPQRIPAENMLEYPMNAWDFCFLLF
jgi:hypothetical protein